MRDVACIYLGGHLHGTVGSWSAARGTRCVILEEIDTAEPRLDDGRAHVIVTCQIYRPNLVSPEFVDDPEGLPLLVLRLAAQIESCNHELH